MPNGDGRPAKLCPIFSADGDPTSWLQLQKFLEQHNSTILIMFSEKRSIGNVRRVVTGFDEKGKSIIQSDTILEPSNSAPNGAAATTRLWSTDAFPTPILDPIDGGKRELQGLGIRSPNGTNLAYHEMYEGSTPMHITKSIDYAVILDGDIEMHLDDGSKTTLTRGDVIIQRGTYHQWIKPKSSTPVKMLVCLVDGAEFEIPGTNTIVKDEIFQK